MPQGFYSFSPRADNKFIKALSDEAKRDLEAGINAYSARDFATAQSLLARPAQEGNTQANWVLARMLLRGLGGPVDKRAAIDILNRMAKGYDPDEPNRSTRFFMVDGLTRLAELLLHGDKQAGIKRNRRRALRLFRRAASAGHAGAQYGLGAVYVRGNGVSRDQSYGLRWLGTAAQKRYAPAASLLGDVYGEAGDIVRATVWYRIAADTANQTLSAHVLEKHETLVQQLSPKQLQRADRLYSTCRSSATRPATAAQTRGKTPSVIHTFNSTITGT